MVFPKLGNLFLGKLYFFFFFFGNCTWKIKIIIKPLLERCEKHQIFIGSESLQNTNVSWESPKDSCSMQSLQNAFSHKNLWGKKNLRNLCMCVCIEPLLSHKRISFLTSQHEGKCWCRRWFMEPQFISHTHTHTHMNTSTYTKRPLMYK